MHSVVDVPRSCGGAETPVHLVQFYWHCDRASQDVIENGLHDVTHVLSLRGFRYSPESNIATTPIVEVLDMALTVTQRCSLGHNLRTECLEDPYRGQKTLLWEPVACVPCDREGRRSLLHRDLHIVSC